MRPQKERDRPAHSGSLLAASTARVTPAPGRATPARTSRRANARDTEVYRFARRERAYVDAQEAHRRRARVSCLIAKLRGHGLVAKVPRARLYRPTACGYKVMTAAIAVLDEQFLITTSRLPKTHLYHADRASYNQNLWIDHLIESAAYLPS